jgi:negative regulator of sigma E activity
MMQNMRKWMITRLGAAVGTAAAVLLVAMLSVGHATEPKAKGKAEEKPVQGQLVCPATPGGVCQVKIECPPLKAPGQTTCKATVDCPEPQKTVKPKKQPKKQ